MKTLKTTSLTIILLLSVNIFAHANSGRKSNTNLDYTLSKYIECITYGNFNDFSKLLDQDFKQFITYEGKTVTYNKRQVVGHMKKTKNIVQNCAIDYSIVENNVNFSIAKIEMKYPTFTKVSYVTMNHCKEGWGISNIFTTYP